LFGLLPPDDNLGPLAPQLHQTGTATDLCRLIGVLWRPDSHMLSDRVYIYSIPIQGGHSLRPIKNGGKEKTNKCIFHYSSYNV